MTLAQRLSRAGLAFIVFGTAVALFPTNGNASAAVETVGCPTNSPPYTVGKNAGDPTPTYLTASSQPVVLNQYLGSQLTTDAKGVTDSNPAFHTSINSSQVETTVPSVPTGTNPVTETVTVAFPSGRYIIYTISVS